MARVTGLEPAASCVTGMRSNQLSYTRVYSVGHVMAKFSAKVNGKIFFPPTLPTGR